MLHATQPKYNMWPTNGNQILFYQEIDDDANSKRSKEYNIIKFGIVDGNILKKSPHSKHINNINSKGIVFRQGQQLYQDHSLVFR